MQGDLQGFLSLRGWVFDLFITIQSVKTAYPPPIRGSSEKGYEGQCGDKVTIE